jgi:hypothetical protein
MHYTQVVSDGLEGLAGIATQDGDPNQAAQLLGAAHAHREAVSMSRRRHQAAGYERDVAAARSQLDAEAWDASWAIGCAMTLEQALNMRWKIPMFLGKSVFQSREVMLDLA